MEYQEITTPDPPYYTVIFSVRTTQDLDGHEELVARMVELAAEQPGFLGIETAQNSDGTGITVSYWQDDASIIAWKKNVEHLAAQEQGRSRFFNQYSIRVGKIERDYQFGKS